MKEDDVKVIAKDAAKSDVAERIWNVFEEEYKERTHNFIDKKDG